MPPIANHGTVSACGRGAKQLQATRDCVLLRRRCERGHPDVVGAVDVAQLFECRDREPEQPIGPDERPRLRDRHVAAADVNAVGAARLDEIRPVVEDEERAVLHARGSERLGGGDERVVVELLVAELDDVDPATQRRLEDVSVTAGEDEVEAGASQSLTHEHTFA